MAINGRIARSLTNACRMINDKVRNRLPIYCSFLEMIMFETERIFSGQVYLEYLYKAIFLLSYYRMMRIGEVTDNQHVFKAKNVHAATNKDKLLLVLYSSKTHGLHHRPQKIKITSKRGGKTGSYMHRNFCPFHVLRVYMNLRGSYCSKDEHFFVFRDKQPVKPQQATVVLRTAIKTIGLDQNPILDALIQNWQK